MLDADLALGFSEGGTVREMRARLAVVSAMAGLAALAAPLSLSAARAPSCVATVFDTPFYSLTEPHPGLGFSLWATCDRPVTGVALELAARRTIRRAAFRVAGRSVPLPVSCRAASDSLACPKAAVPANVPFGVEATTATSVALGEPVRLTLSFPGGVRLTVSTQAVSYLPHPPSTVRAG